MRAYRPLGVRGWPALVLVGPDGFYEGVAPGEGNYDALDESIGKLARKHDKTLNREELKFKLEEEKPTGPLLFPGKVAATEKLLFIADTGHHRIVVTDHDGAVQDVIGSGKRGRADGAYAACSFNQPMGMAASGDALWVADTENHLIRRVDLKAKKVETVAGTGERKSSRGGPALKTTLNSPWDVLVDGRRVFVAMAGNHTIWVLADGRVEPYAGDFYERLQDGPLRKSSFNQPSGLAAIGRDLYVADSEISGVRRVPMDGKGEVTTVVGTGLFSFGDRDGVGAEALLQHVLHVAAGGGKLYVADAYNHKVKVIDPATRECTTFAGDGKPGVFFEPGGLAVAGGRLFVADTNNHAIRVVDLATREVKSVTIRGMRP